MTHREKDGTKTYYSRFLGGGPPLDVLGRPGDIFVDIRMAEEGIFMKDGDRWIEWPGVTKMIGGQRCQGLNTTLHPRNERLTIWCDRDGIYWMDRGRLAAASERLFTRFPGKEVITARRLIIDSDAIVDEISHMYMAELEGRIKARNERYLNYQSSIE